MQNFIVIEELCSQSNISHEVILILTSEIIHTYRKNLHYLEIINFAVILFAS